jgi:hypothetical protein
VKVVIDTVAGFLVGGSKDGRVKDMMRKLPVGEAVVQLNHPQPKDAFRCRIGTEEQRRLAVPRASDVQGSLRA